MQTETANDLCDCGPDSLRQFADDRRPAGTRTPGLISYRPKVVFRLPNVVSEPPKVVADLPAIRVAVSEATVSEAAVCAPPDW